MGMIGYVRQVTPFELASFRRNPKPIKELLDKEILDGFSTDVRFAVAMMQELLNRGYKEEEIRKVLGLNALRVMREAEKVARVGKR